MPVAIEVHAPPLPLRLPFTGPQIPLSVIPTGWCRRCGAHAIWLSLYIGKRLLECYDEVRRGSTCSM